MHEGASKIFFSKAREPRSSLLENSKWCGAPGPPIPWRVTGTAPAKNSFLAAGITPPIPRSWPPIVRGFRNNCHRKAQGNARNLPFILLAVCFTVYQFPHSLTVKSTRHFSYGAGLHLGLVYIYIYIYKYIMFKCSSCKIVGSKTLANVHILATWLPGTL